VKAAGVVVCDGTFRIFGWLVSVKGASDWTIVEMKKSLIILFAWVPFVLSGETLSEDQIEIRTVEERGRVVYRKGEGEPFTGRVVSCFADGTLEYSANYKDGRRVGLCEKFYPGGGRKLRVNYSIEPERIEAQGWYPDGSRFFEAEGKSFWSILSKRFWSKEGQETSGDPFWFRGEWPYRRGSREDMEGYTEAYGVWFSQGSGKSIDEPVIILSMNHPGGNQVVRYWLNRHFPKFTMVGEGYVMECERVIKWSAIETADGELTTTYFDVTDCFSIL